MAADVSWLGDAMEAAGFRTIKSLAEAAGMSLAGVGRIIKLGRCNPSSAERLQAACGEHLIGPHMQRTAEAEEAARKTREEDVFGDLDLPSMAPLFRDAVDGAVVVTGTRKPEGGLLEHGAVVIRDGERVAEDWGYTSHWPARAWGCAVAAGKEPPEPHPFHKWRT